jgi:hypothetical protein
MKQWTYLLLFTIISCDNLQSKVNNFETALTARPYSPADAANISDICWTGTLNGRTPVFLHYKTDGNLITGQITYLNTKDKLPITISGTIEDDKSYRLLEFEKSGNITGVITGLPTNNNFNGSWYSPKTRKELSLNLVKKDTVIHPGSIETKLQDIFGHYHYQYGDAGYQGDFEITKLPGSKAIFGITSVTGEPARNVAQVDDDTISLSATHFTYRLPDTSDCEFEVKFYKGFALIKYTKGICYGQFGLNATVEGIFIKTGR